jgi:hypothetical protein
MGGVAHDAERVGAPANEKLPSDDEQVQEKDAPEDALDSHAIESSGTRDSLRRPFGRSPSRHLDAHLM